MTELHIGRRPDLRSMPVKRLLAAYATEFKYEFLRLLRLPAFALPTVLLPTGLFLILNLYGRTGGHGSAYVLATGIVFGSIAPGLFGVGISVATDRMAGLLVLKRAFPVPSGSYLAAKLIMAVAFAAIVTSLLIFLATLFHTPLTAAKVCKLFAIGSLGVLPFCALGMLIGLLISAQAAPAIVNILYIAMCVLSGIWIPMSRMPAFVQTIAPVWPAFHLTQMAHAAATDTPAGSTLGHMAILLITTGILFIAGNARMRQI